MLVDGAGRVPPRFVSAKRRRKKRRLFQQPGGAAIVVGIPLELADEQALEIVDGRIRGAKIVVERQHFDEQARTQPERRLCVRRGGIARRGIEQHFPLEIAEAARRCSEPRVHRVVPPGARQDLRQAQRAIAREACSS